jgi:hypothetical protein
LWEETFTGLRMKQLERLLKVVLERGARGRESGDRGVCRLPTGCW